MKNYGISDSEKMFVKYLSGMFKEIKINSVQEWNDFSNNPRERIKQIMDEIEGNIREKKSEKEAKQIRKEEIKNSLQGIYFGVGRKIETLKKCYGPLRNKIQSEIDDLKEQKEELKKESEEVNHDILVLNTQLNNLSVRKIEAGNNLKDDEEKLSGLRNNKEVLNLLAGAHGENTIIKQIQKEFENEKNFYLINSFNLDLVGACVRVEDNTLSENRIDHILICPHGIFVIETKNWKAIHEDSSDRVVKQLLKTKKIFEKIFDNKIYKNTHYVIIATKKMIISNNKEVESITNDGLKKFVTFKKPILSNDDINMIVKEFLPHMNESHLGKIEKFSILTKAGITSTKRYLGGLLKKISRK